MKIKFYEIKQFPIFGLLLAFIFFIAAPSYATDVRYLTYSGRIVDDAGNPLNGSVQFKIQITDTLGTCVFWEETLTDTLTAGVFALQIGRGTNSFDGFGVGSLEGIFKQGLAINCKGSTPSASVTPTITDDRNMIVNFNDGTGWQTVASQIPIRSVPYALYSENVAKLVGYPIAVTAAPLNGQVLQFQTGSGTWVPTTLSAGGAVGAGTAAAPGYAFTGNTNTGIFSPGVNQVAISTNGSEALRVDATGKVGIGTTTPTTALEVNGDMSLSNNGIVDAVRTISVSGATRNDLKLSANVDGQGGTAGQVRLAAGGFNGGSVNITAGDGSVTNGAAGSVNITAGTAINPAGGSISLTGGASTTGSVGGSIYLVGGTSSASTPGNVILTTTSAGVNRGNVGIGTSNPLEKFHLMGADALISTSNMAAGSQIYLRSSAGTGGIIEIKDMDDTNSVQGEVKFTDASGLAVGRLGGYNLYTNAEFGLRSNKALNLDAGDITRIRVDGTTGNVGVGTMAPAEKLEVNGGVKLGTSANTNAGTLRWDGTNFQGYNGVGWISFLPQTPPAGGCDLTQSYSSAGTFGYTVPASFGTITIRIWGAGGGGGAAYSGTSNGNGSNGGNSSVNSLGLVAGGGLGGVGTQATSVSGASGAVTATGGDINTLGAAAGSVAASGASSGGTAPNGGGNGGVAQPAGNSGTSGAAPGGGGSGAVYGATASASGGGSGGYVEKVYTPGTLTPGTYINDIIVGSGGGGSCNGVCSGLGGTGRVSIVCSSTGSTPANDRGIVFWNAGKHDSVTSLVYTATGNVGVGTAAPQGVLDVASTSSGLVLPRMTKVQRNAIVSPVAGMAIYQTDNTPGLRVYNGINWMKFTETAD